MFRFLWLDARRTGGHLQGSRRINNTHVGYILFPISLFRENWFHQRIESSYTITWIYYHKSDRHQPVRIDKSKTVQKRAVWGRKGDSRRLLASIRLIYRMMSCIKFSKLARAGEREMAFQNTVHARILEERMYTVVGERRKHNAITATKIEGEKQEVEVL